MLPDEPVLPDEDGNQPGAMDDTLPDLPVMEPLPGQDALPDPGYPEMPAAPRSAADARDTAADAPWPPRPAFYPAAPPERPRAAEPVLSPDPYAAPRLPDAAPPLHGPSVPWSAVRAGGQGTAGRPSAAPRVPPSDPGPGPAPGPPADLAGPAGPAEPVGGPRPPVPPVPAAASGGWRRLLPRATRGRGRGAGPAAARDDLIRRVRAPLAAGHYRVAVLGLKGGVGKTTVTVGLGATLASLRGDRVIAVDASPGGGTLADRVWPQAAASVRDLLHRRAMISGYPDVRACTAQAASGLEVLAADRDPAVSAAFSADDYRAVAAVLGHYYAIALTDCGTGLLHPAMTGVLELADQIILVTSPAVDGARSAATALDWLQAHQRQDLVRSAVVVLSAVRPPGRSAIDVDRLEQHFATRCRAVVRIPYDQHLEEGAAVELSFLNPETAWAYISLAALIADDFARPPRSAADAAPGPPLA